MHCMYKEDCPNTDLLPSIVPRAGKTDQCKYGKTECFFGNFYMQTVSVRRQLSFVVTDKTDEALKPQGYRYYRTVTINSTSRTS